MCVKFFNTSFVVCVILADNVMRFYFCNEQKVLAMVKNVLCLVMAATCTSLMKFSFLCCID